MSLLLDSKQGPDPALHDIDMCNEMGIIGIKQDTIIILRACICQYLHGFVIDCKPYKTTCVLSKGHACMQSILSPR